MLFLTALTAAAAQFSVHLPFTPVPLTLQPMIVLVGIGGARAASRRRSQVLYLLLGIAGLPVFAASPILPQGAAPAARADRRLPAGVSAGGVRHRVGWPSAASIAAI